MQIKFFKKENNFKKEKQISPYFYWKIILAVSLLIIIASFIFSYFLFIRIKQDFVLSQDNAGSQSQIVKKERIDKVLQYFSDRETKSNEIIILPSSVVDPSL